MASLRYAVLLAAALVAAPAFAQAPAGQVTMQALRDKLQADKKLVVAANMDLSAEEAQAFWPIYEEYQKELQKVNERLATAIVSYASSFKAKSLSDDQAMALTKQAMAIEDDESLLRMAMAQRLGTVLPGRKVARYMQIESKVRAIVKYEIAAEVPLVP